MSDVKIAYAVVQCADFRTPSVTKVSSNGISAVDHQENGMFIVTFEEGFFSNVPSVQVTAMFNGFKGNALNSVTSSNLATDFAPANQVVHACIVWTDKTSCQLRTALADQGFGSWLSFSITATGT